MDITPEEEIWSEIFKRYNRNPLGMRMFSGLSVEGYPELLIHTPEISWLLKRESMYSGRRGIGGAIEGEIPKPPEIIQYGFRPVPGNFVKSLIAMAKNRVPPEQAIGLVFGMIRSTLAQQPRSFDETSSPIAFNGPIAYSHQPLSGILGGQTELYGKLDNELNKLRRHLPYV